MLLKQSVKPMPIKMTEKTGLFVRGRSCEKNGNWITRHETVFGILSLIHQLRTCPQTGRSRLSLEMEYYFFFNNFFDLFYFLQKKNIFYLTFFFNLATMFYHFANQSNDVTLIHLKGSLLCVSLKS